MLLAGALKDFLTQNKIIDINQLKESLIPPHYISDHHAPHTTSPIHLIPPHLYTSYHLTYTPHTTTPIHLIPPHLYTSTTYPIYNSYYHAHVCMYFIQPHAQFTLQMQQCTHATCRASTYLGEQWSSSESYGRLTRRFVFFNICF